jgi:hypothetical protein
VRTIPSLLLGLFLGGAVFGSVNLLGAAPPLTAPAAPLQVGRYQITDPDKDQVWLVDTATGDTWRRSSGSKWTKAGNPAADQK